MGKALWLTHHTLCATWSFSQLFRSPRKVSSLVLVNQWDGEYLTTQPRTIDLNHCYRRNLPHDLADEIEDARDKGESVLNVSVGVDGDWFIRTEVRHCE